MERPEQSRTAWLESPNDYLRVKEKGLYEILEVSSSQYCKRPHNMDWQQVSDSQCPGMVVAQESTYEVDWVPRPSARISPDTEAVYESYNGTYILPAICEGTSGHVDFDLTGHSFVLVSINMPNAFT
jgi:nucleoporin POM152